MTPRFLVDRGTATTSAALIARLGRRWRLLGAQAFPAGVELESVLGHVAGQAAGTFGDPESGRWSWQDWASFERVEARTVPPHRIVVVAPSARRAAELSAAAERGGWLIAAQASPDRDDGVAIGAALAARDATALLMGAADPPRSDEREPLAELAAHAGAVIARRPSLVIILAGAATEHRERFPFERLVFAPPPRAPEASPAGDELARILTALGGQLDGSRMRAVRSIATLAEVRDETIELADVGASAGAWFRATPDQLVDGFVIPSGALVPEGSDDDETVLDQLIAWSPLRLDRPTHRDRLRDLRAHPWWDAAGEGALLRMAAARAALERLEDERLRFGGSAPDQMPNPDLIVLAGGAFAAAPPAAIALAAADTIRRSGLTRMACDHARLLGPLGMLDDDERREAISDLAEDLLLPLGSLLILSGGRPGRDLGSLSVSSDWVTAEPQPLSGGTLRLIELPPGAPATLNVELRDGRLGRRRPPAVALEATGGLGGLLVDTRGVPLRLPEAGERRREVLAQWQHSLWPGAE